MEDREQIRRAYFLEHKSARQIAKELNISRNTVRNALDNPMSEYTLHKPRQARMIGPYQGLINEILAENEKLPRKQKYTTRRIYQQINKEGFLGAESTVRRYIGQLRQQQKALDVYLPLEFDMGMDAQVDWGEGIVILNDESITAQLFMMRLCFSRRLFVMAFPFGKQEAFLEGHVCAFHYFGGIPKRLTYDNLTVAVRRVLEGRNRQEQETFIAFRSHYLFESHFCTPGQAHQKGGIEHGIGYGRRNFLVPPPKVNSFEELNANLIASCMADDSRYVHGQQKTIKENWELEKAYLLPLPERDWECCVTRCVRVNPYSQVEFETNRYSVPVDNAYRELVLKAYPFRVDILHGHQVIASHRRSMSKETDVIEPIHYLPLLEQRPGAFEHAKPMLLWREQLPPVYEQLLTRLRTEDNHGIREFLKVLSLHKDYPAEKVEQAVTQALAYGCVHRDGILLCLHQLVSPQSSIAPLDLTGKPNLAGIGSHSVDIQCYEQLLGERG